MEYISRRWFLTPEEFAAEEDVNRQLIALLEDRYGGHPLEDFGSHLRDGDHAGLFFDYWRAYLAVSRVIERLGGVLEAFDACRRWRDSDSGMSLVRWLDLPG